MAGQVGGAGFDIPLLSGGKSAGADVASTVGEAAKFTETKGAVSNEGGTELSGHLGDASVNSMFNNVGDPDAKVIGHNEISEKDCPCFDVQKWKEDNL